MIRSKLVSGAAAAAAALFSVGLAHAATFGFSYSFPTTDTADFPTGFTSGSGVITATNEGGGEYLVTDVTGSWNGEMIIGVAPLNTDGGNDNLLFPAGPYFDNGGLGFTVVGPIAGDSGLGIVNVYYDSRLRAYSDNSESTDYAGFTLTVPEPAGWALMLVGLGGLGAVLRSRRQAIAAQA